DLVDTVMYLAKSQGRNKAYGVDRIDAEDALSAAQLTARLESAWNEGLVGLQALHGPAVARTTDFGSEIPMSGSGAAASA
ncbi:MAG: hypothetical protein V3T11_17080, partial [Roseateles sp.]